MVDIMDAYGHLVMPEPNSGCWLWEGALNKDGYGRARYLHKDALAHRVSYQISYGAIPSGLNVLHKCDNPPCVNPGHLWVGTQKENQQDAVDKGRRKHVMPPVRLGCENSQAILSTKDILSIRSDGRSQQKIAASFGISQQHVSKIKLRRRWGHL